MSSSNHCDPSLEEPEENLYELSKKKPIGSKKVGSKKSGSLEASLLKSISQPIQRSNKVNSNTTEPSKASSKKVNLLDIDSLMSDSSSTANIQRHAFSVKRWPLILQFPSFQRLKYYHHQI